MPQGDKERKLSPKSYFFNKAKNLQKLQFARLVLPNIYLNKKYKIVLFDKSQIWLIYSEELTFAEFVISKEYGPSKEVNFVFSGNPSQNILRLIYEIE